jgi:hypothetical protein
MVNYIFEQLKNNKLFKFTFILFVLMVLWWSTIYIRGLTEGIENDSFTIVLPVFSLIGSIVGWGYAKKWGGLKSLLGRSISMFTYGLLAQFLGYLLYTYYIYILGVEVPYPSIGDALFFGSVLFYMYGAYILAKVAGISFSFTNVRNKVLAVLIPVAILLLSYVLFLNGYEPDWSNLVVVFLDFGYPIGQAIYVSIAIFALLASKDILGGMMKRPILLLIFALIVQYIADFSFSYQVSRGTWYVGGTNDFLYMLAGFLMTLALFSIGNMFYKVQES